MAKSLSQLRKQIALLQRQADAIKKKDAQGVIARIKEAIETYGITAGDLGFTSPSGKRAKEATKPRRQTQAAKKSGKYKTPINYRDAAGNEWSGHGRRPQWYLAAIAAGTTPEQLAA